jgi:hypothetical protein
MNSRTRFPAIAALALAHVAGPGALAQDPPPTQPDATATAPATSPGSTLPPRDLPAAKTVIERSIDAMGGRAAFDALKSVATKAEVSGPMAQMSLEMNWMAPNLILVKQAAENSGVGTSIGSDGMVTWAKGPLDCQILPNDQAKQIQQQASMFLLVHRIESEHDELKTIDQVKFGEHDCFKIHGKDRDGIESDFYFDTKEYLIRGGETTMPSQMGEMTQIVRFSEWKQDAGIKYFTRLDIEQMGMSITLTMTEVKFNTLDASLFALPDEVKAMLKDRETSPPATAPATSPSPQAPGGDGR